MNNNENNEYALPVLPRSRNNTIQKMGQGNHYITGPMNGYQNSDN